MSDQYDFFATPRAPSPDVTPVATPQPVAAPAAAGYGQSGGYGAPAQVPVAYAAPVPAGWQSAPSYARPARPGVVVASAVLVFVQAAIVLLFSVLVLMLLGAVSDAPIDARNSALLAMFVLLALGGAGVWLGIRILQGSRGAAIAVTVLEGLAMTPMLLGVYYGSRSGFMTGGVLVSWSLWLAYPIALLICLWHPSSRRWYSR